MSRYEKIINMSIDDMANLLAVMCKQSDTCYGCLFEPNCPESEAVCDWKKWLESEGKG